MFANRLFLGAVLFLLSPVPGQTEESPTFGSILDTGRQVYQDVVILRVTPTHLFFRHSRGLASLPISQLPPEVRVQIEGRIPGKDGTAIQPASPKPSAPAAAPTALPGASTPLAPKKTPPRAPATRTRPLWVLYPIRNQPPSPLGTGAIPGLRGLPLNWFHVHPAVFPQTLANPEWRRLAERDFLITSARNNPALLTRQIVSGW